MSKQSRYYPEVWERAVRMVFDHQAEYESQWAAMSSIAAKIGCTAETPRKWVRQAEKDQGIREGLSSNERERLKALDRRLPWCSTDQKHAKMSESTKRRIWRSQTEWQQLSLTWRPPPYWPRSPSVCPTSWMPHADSVLAREPTSRPPRGTPVNSSVSWSCLAPDRPS